MNRPAVHQLLAGFAEGDAVSLAARCLRSAFRGMGLDAEIYADPAHTAPGCAGDCRPLGDFPGRDGDLVLHHYAIWSRAAEAFRQAAGRKVLVYHNITPPRFFEGFSDPMVRQLTESLNRLPEVAGAADAVWADSAYNAADLARAGVEGARVFPLPFDRTPLDVKPDRELIRAHYPEPLTNLLFVGRMAPNKCVEELVLMYAHYFYNINPRSRLILVGSERSCPTYFAMLRMLAGEIGLQNVCFERYLSAAGLAACYGIADVFVTCSRHEGYCLPLLEAAYKGVPVIARNEGGMPEALGGAGVLFEEAGPAVLAELVHRVATDPTLRGEVLASQQRRVDEVLGRSMESELRALLGDWIPG